MFNSTQDIELIYINTSREYFSGGIKFYTIYKTVNKLNHKVYYGKHITKDPYDGYIGSGKYLKRAINKYGIENFEKFVLYIFDNEKDMNDKEAELYLKTGKTYNLKLGGEGG